MLAALLLAALAAVPAAAPARAEEAREITRECRMSPGSKKKDFKKALDGDYRTFWNSAAGKGAEVIVQVPAGEEAGGVWFQWYEHEHAAAVQIRNAAGEWEEYACTEGAFLSEFLQLPEGTKEFRITNPKKARKSTPIPLAELHVYGRGEIPARVQRWEPPVARADLMLLAGHPDDELLWFGGVLPVYAGVQGKKVQVCILVPTLPRRRLEELDGLWTCGVRNYPVFGYFRDQYSESLSDQYEKWSRDAVYKLVTGWIRRFRPEVVITHDVEGEYGHGAHRACADAVIKALDFANDRKKFKDSAAEYGVWNVPKTYIHLYPENRIEFDWRVPLEAFGGRTALEVAQEAFACHVSQAHTEYRVEDFGPGDCRVFGLYRSLVGPDENHDDLFENLSLVVEDGE